MIIGTSADSVIFDTTHLPDWMVTTPTNTQHILIAKFMDSQTDYDFSKQEKYIISQCMYSGTKEIIRCGNHNKKRFRAINNLIRRGLVYKLADKKYALTESGNEYTEVIKSFISL